MIWPGQVETSPWILFAALASRTAMSSTNYSRKRSRRFVAFVTKFSRGSRVRFTISMINFYCEFANAVATDTLMGQSNPSLTNILTKRIDWIYQLGPTHILSLSACILAWQPNSLWILIKGSKDGAPVFLFQQVRVCEVAGGRMENAPKSKSTWFPVLDPESGEARSANFAGNWRHAVRCFERFGTPTSKEVVRVGC